MGGDGRRGREEAKMTMVVARSGSKKRKRLQLGDSEASNKKKGIMLALSKMHEHADLMWTFEGNGEGEVAADHHLGGEGRHWKMIDMPIGNAFGAVDNHHHNHHRQQDAAADQRPPPLDNGEDGEEEKDGEEKQEKKEKKEKRRKKKQSSDGKKNRKRERKGSFAVLPLDVFEEVCHRLKARSLVRLSASCKSLGRSVDRSWAWKQLYELHSPVMVPSQLYAAPPKIWRGLYQALFVSTQRQKRSAWGREVDCPCPIKGCGAVVRPPSRMLEHISGHFVDGTRAAPATSVETFHSVDGQGHVENGVGCPHCTCSSPCLPPIWDGVGYAAWVTAKGWDAERARKALSKAREDTAWHATLPNLSEARNKIMFPRLEAAKGLSRKGKKWRSIVKFGGVKVVLGAFDRREHAALVYDVAKRLFMPPCARTADINYPNLSPPDKACRALGRLVRAKVAAWRLGGKGGKERDMDSLIDVFDVDDHGSADVWDYDASYCD